MKSTSYLIPRPVHLQTSKGAFPLRNLRGVVLRDIRDPRIVRAVRGLECALQPYTGNRSPASIVVDVRPSSHGEAYELTIAPDGIAIHGAGLPGVFYGLQTLLQLIRCHGNKLPLLHIQDCPAFPHRGYYLDVSRGKMPKVKTIKTLIDRLAAFKINQFQLYIEHVFDFRFDPSIGRGCCPLTARDIRELDTYCHDRFIDFVPSLTCFGHMGRILSLPRHRNLAEVDWPARDWESATWLQRLRGATLNPLDPRSRTLIARMLDEYLPLFRSGYFNMCGDETYDLGKGRSASVAARKGVDRLYVDHLKFIRRQAAKHGKRVMFWGDVMLHHPRALADIPGDCTALDWGYYPTTRFEKVGDFIQAGLNAYVCPSVRGYRTVFNDVEEARTTIAAYARTGLRLGANGLLNTDWGDMGHFNLPAASLHGMALGAAMSWNPASDEGRAFDRAFSIQMFGDFKNAIGTIYSKAGSTAFSTWPILLSGYDQPEGTKATIANAVRLKRDLPGWLRKLNRLPPRGLSTETDIRQLTTACHALLFNVEAFLLTSGPGRNSSRRRPSLAARLKSLRQDYRKRWLADNRPCGLDEIEARVFDPVARALGGKPPPAKAGTTNAPRS